MKICKSGRHSYPDIDKACRECISLNKAAYYRANRQKLKAHKAAYRAANQDKDNERSRAYRAANREKLNAYNAAWREANPEWLKAYFRAYRDANPEKRAAQNAKWREANPGYPAARDSKRRAHLLGIEGTFTPEEWLAVKARQEDRCAICGTECDLTVDHIIPLSRGGSNYASNIQGLCKPCNSSKGTKLPEELQLQEAA